MIEHLNLWKIYNKEEIENGDDNIEIKNIILRDNNENNINEKNISIDDLKMQLQNATVFKNYPKAMRLVI